jgi:hypothetical protein
MRAHRQTGSRFRYGVLVLNGDGPGSIAWHRGILPRYAGAGEPLRMPVELEEIDSLADAPILKRNPFTWVVALRAGGQSWALRVQIWDLDLLFAALGIEPDNSEDGQSLAVDS